MLTFAIPTNIKSDEQRIQLNNLIHSIEHQSVRVEHEILVCGNYKDDRVTTIDFPEDLNGTAYITRKQNLLVENAKYDIIVFIRDYEVLWSDWVCGFLYYVKNVSTDWDVLLSPVLNKDGTRWRDKCIWDDPRYGGEWVQREKWCKNGRLTCGQPHLNTYDNDSPYLYVNGGYMVCKKEFMLSHRFNEELQWGDGEDVFWSLISRMDWNYQFNPYSIVQLQKQKDRILPVIPNSYFGTFEYIMSKYKR